MVSKLVDLPSELLLLICDSHLAWNDAVMLYQSHPTLHEKLSMSDYKEKDWRKLLLSRHIGKSVLDTNRSWKEMACRIAFHATRCTVCEAALVRADEQSDVNHVHKANEPSVLSKKEASSDKEIKIHNGIRYDYDLMSRFCKWPTTHSLLPLVWLYGRVPHAERARLSLPLVIDHFQLNAEEAKSLYKSLRDRQQHPLRDQFFADSKTRLDQHIVLSSLLATNKAISTLAMDVHDHVFGLETPPRTSAIWPKQIFVVNRDGITVLDIMRSVTDWKDDGLDLYEQELLPFAGIKWDPEEWVGVSQDMSGESAEPGSGVIPVEILAVYQVEDTPPLMAMSDSEDEDGDLFG